MSESDWVYCDSYGINVMILKCKGCKIKERQMVSSYEECPYYGKVMIMLAKVRND